jgi:hypothetical protein
VKAVVNVNGMVWVGAGEYEWVLVLLPATFRSLYWLRVHSAATHHPLFSIHRMLYKPPGRASNQADR